VDPHTKCGGPCSPFIEKLAMVDEQTIQDLCNPIVQDFQPERIILFGSYAYGNPTPDSDVKALDRGKVLYELPVA